MLAASLPLAQWLERPTGVRKVMGSFPVGDSDFSLSHAREMLIIPSFLMTDYDRYPTIYVNDHYLEVHCRFSFTACLAAILKSEAVLKILTPWKKLSTIKCSQKVNKYLLQLTEISRG